MLNEYAAETRHPDARSRSVKAHRYECVGCLITDAKTWPFKHSSLSLPLKRSMKGFFTGFRVG
jgi:hypothetical protein